ncbi:MAG: HAD family hydrolase [Thermoanaerobaculia bacterium]
MDRVFDVVTFDCYGTLIDWEEGISSAILSAAERDGRELERAAVLRAYSEIEPQVEGESFRPYREVLAETASRVAARFGWELPAERASFLAESLPRWKPFPDTNAALARLASQGYRLGILSNTDDDLLAATRESLTASFSLVLTAQQMRSYKPGYRHFEAARAQLGEARWLHAAQSYFHDVVPAHSLCIPSAWINRKGEAPSGTARPDFEFPSLAQMADFLCGAQESF